MTQLAMGDTRKTDVCSGCYRMLRERKVGIFFGVLYMANDQERAKESGQEMLQLLVL